MNWMSSSKQLSEYRTHLDWMVTLWENNHPDEPINYDAAKKEYAEFRKMDARVFSLSSRHTRRKIEKEILGVRCPNCGAQLEWEYLPMCGKANPKRYTGVFACSSENCLYHVFTREGFIDLVSKLSAGRFVDIGLIAPVL